MDAKQVLEYAKLGNLEPIKALINKHESKRRGYSDYNRGGISGGSGIFTDTLNENLIAKTIGQILTQQSMI